MKLFLKILASVFLIVVLVAFGALGYFVVHAQTLIPSFLERQLGFKPRIERIRVELPSTVIVEGFSLEGGISAERISITPSLAGLLSREVVLNELIVDRPRMTVTRLPDDSFDLGLPPSASRTQPAPPAPSASSSKGETKKAFPFYVEKLQVRGGIVDFVDRGIVDQPPFFLSLADLDIDIVRISLLQPFKMRIEGAGRLVSEGKKPIGTLNLSGWADPLARDMDIKALLSNVLLTALEPYTRKIFGQPLTSGEMDFVADLKSQDNDLKGECHAEFSAVSLEAPPAPSAAEGEAPVRGKDLTAILAGAFLTPQGQAVFDFSFRTKMDRPRFEKVKIKGTFLESAVRQIVGQPAPKTSEDFKEIGQQFKAIGDEFKNVFRKR